MKWIKLIGLWLLITTGVTAIIYEIGAVLYTILVFMASLRPITRIGVPFAIVGLVVALIMIIFAGEDRTSGKRSALSRG